MKFLLAAVMVVGSTAAFAQEPWSEAASLRPGFAALRQRVDAERAARGGSLQRAPWYGTAQSANDVLKACPEIDAATFARRPLPQAVGSVQACLDRIYGAWMGPDFFIEVRAALLMGGECPGDRGMVRCASLSEMPGILIGVRGRSSAAERAVSELRFAVAVERSGKIEDWNASVEQSTR